MGGGDRCCQASGTQELEPLLMIDRFVGQPSQLVVSGEHLRHDGVVD